MTPATEELEDRTQSGPIEGFSLSRQQQRAWELGADRLLRTRLIASLPADPDLDRLRRAVARVVDRHEILRTRVAPPPGMTLPLQMIDQAPPPQLEEIGRSPDAVERWLDAPSARDPLARVAVASGAAGAELVIDLSPLAGDPRSALNLLAEIAAAYGEPRDQRAELGEPLQYVDFTDWQSALVEDDEEGIGAEHWRAVDLPAGDGRSFLDVELPFARPEGRADGPRPGSVAVPVAGDAVGPAAALAAWQLLLGRLVGAERMVVGTVVDGRDPAELEPAVGAFEQRVPVVGSWDPTTPFDRLVAALQAELEEAERWQHWFDWQHLEAQPTGQSPDGADATESAPQLRFAFRHLPVGLPELDLVSLDPGGEAFDLELMLVAPAGGPHRLEIRFDRRRHDRADVERLAAQLADLLDRATAAPTTAVSRLEALAPDERRREGQVSQAGEPAAPAGDPVPERFARAADRHPDRPALATADGVWTYRRLDRWARSLATRLERSGVGPDVPVAVCGDAGPATVASLLAVWRAGGAFVPLDPEQPPARLRLLLDDSGVGLVLVDGAAPRPAGLDGFTGQVIEVSEPTEDGEAAETHRSDPEARETLPASLAYLVYTSGSTGRPKAVAVEHRQLAAYVSAVSERLGLPEGASFGMVSTLAADLGFTALFPALASGGTLVLASRREARDPAALAHLFARHPVDCLKIVPGHLEALLDGPEPRTCLPRRCLVLGGEAASQTLVERLAGLDGAPRVLNHYGPTETTVGVATGELPQTAQAAPPRRGLPLTEALAHARVHLVDRHLTPAPAWAPAEVLVGGRGVARGYAGSPRRTAERFVPDPFAGAPFSPEPGGRLYRTGDRARRRSDLGIELLGRIDRQVKVRGFRVELSEIEALLTDRPEIAEAVVVLRTSGPGGERLIAYVRPAAQPAEAASIEPTALLAHLGRHLPEAMVPAAVVPVERFPRTPNGKIDHAALPEPREGASGGAVPATPTEQILAGVWSDLLDREVDDRQADFFALGGHSLLATRLASRVRKLFGVEIPLPELFARPTLVGLAARIDQGSDGDALPPLIAGDPEGDHPLSFSQQRLWFVEQLQPGTADYTVPAAIDIRGPLDLEALDQTLGEILRRHRVLRARLVTVEGRPVQRIGPQRPFVTSRVDLRALDPARRDATVLRLAGESARRPFELDGGPLVRSTLLRVEDERSVLLFDYHHIVGDAWSLDVLLGEVTSLYQSFAAGREPSLPELPVQYTDYARWQRAWLSGETLQRELDFWRDHLDGAPRGLDLPTDRPRHGGAPVPARWPLEIASELGARVREASRLEGVTVFMTLLATLDVLLFHLSGRTDVVVGTNVANRIPIETEPLVGFFINQLVLRTDLGGDPTFRQLLGRVRTTTLSSYAHQHLPYERLVEELQPERGARGSLLFDVKIDYQNRSPRFEVAGLEMSQLEIGYDVQRYDLYLPFADGPDGLSGAIDYDASLFERATVERLGALYLHLLAAVVEDPEVPLSTLVRRLAERRAELEEREGEDLERAARQKLNRIRRRAGSPQ